MHYRESLLFLWSTETRCTFCCPTLYCTVTTNKSCHLLERVWTATVPLVFRDRILSSNEHPYLVPCWLTVGPELLTDSDFILVIGFVQIDNISAKKCSDNFVSKWILCDSQKYITNHSKTKSKPKTILCFAMWKYRTNSLSKTAEHNLKLT